MLKPLRGITLNTAHPLARGLVDCWIINEQTGAVLCNLANADRPGSIVGQDKLLWAPGGLKNTDTDAASYVDIGDYPQLSELTVMAKVMVNDESIRWQRIVQRAHDDGFGWSLRYDSNRLLFQDRRIDDYNASFPGITAGKIYMVVGSSDRTTRKIYVDGILGNDTVNDGAGDGGGVALQFFRRSNQSAYPFIGNINIVCIWDRVLSAAEVRALSAAPYQMFERASMARLFAIIASGGQSASIADTITLADANSALAAYSAGISDSVGLGDSESALGAYLRSLSDTISLSDATAIIAAYKASAVDTLSLTDTLSGLAGLLASSSDTVTLTDSTAARASLAAGIADTLSLIDSITTDGMQSAAISDTFGLTDSTVAVASFIAALVDTVGLSDSIVALLALKAAVIDTVSLTDTINGLAGLIATAFDSLDIVDAVTWATDSTASILDTIALSDSATGILHFTVEISDTVSMADAETAIGNYASALIDTFGLSDKLGIIAANGVVSIVFAAKRPIITFGVKK